MVLENTLTPAGLLREPWLYATCLIREGQQPKAAAYLLRCVASGAIPAGQKAAFEDLTAALLVTPRVLPAPARPEPPEAARWRELAAASRAALAAWVDGASPEEVDRHLKRISLRSAFRPVRLLLQNLTTLPPDAERARQRLESIEPGSPFFPFRQAVEAAMRTGPGLDADAWHRLTPVQQAFAAETGGLQAGAVQSLGRLSTASRGGPAALFAWLLAGRPARGRGQERLPQSPAAGPRPHGAVRDALRAVAAAGAAPCPGAGGRGAWRLGGRRAVLVPRRPADQRGRRPDVAAVVGRHLPPLGTSRIAASRDRGRR